MQFTQCRDPDAEPIDVWIDETPQGSRTNIQLCSKDGEIFEYSLPFRAKRECAERDAAFYVPGGLSDRSEALYRELSWKQRFFGDWSCLT